MLDHIFLPVSNLARSIAFYEKVLLPLGITHVHDFHPTSSSPPDHPSLYGFGKNSRISFWLKQGEIPVGGSMHVGFLASSNAEVDECWKVATQEAEGAEWKEGDKPGYREYYDPRYYAGSVRDPDGHSLEFTFKSWQH